MVVGDLTLADHDMVRENTRTASWKPQPIASSGNLEFGPGGGATGIQFGECFLNEVQSGSGGVGLEVGTARSRSSVFDHFGMCHSNSVSGNIAVLGRLILTLCPVALT